MKAWIEPYLKKHKGRMFLTVLLGFIGIGSGAMLLFVSGYLISKSALQPVNLMIVYVPIVAVRALSLSQAVMLYLERLVGHDVILRILEKMRTRLYRALELQALFLQSRYQTGDLLSMLSEDIEHLQDFYLRTVFPSVLSLLLYAFFVIVLGLFDWTFALLMALTLAVIVFLIPLISLRVTRRKYIDMRKSRGHLYEQLTNAVFGLSDWQASGRVGTFLTNYTKEEDKLRRTEKKMRQWQHIRDGILQLFVGIAVMMMIVWTGQQTETAQIAPTVIAAFVLMLFSVTDALTPTSEAMERIPSYQEALQRVTAIEQAKIPIGEKLMKVAEIVPRSAEVFAEAPKDPGAIRLKNISFRYPESEQYVLRDFSLTVKSGKKIAILGRSGTGKSTLLKLLTGTLQPTTGSVSIEGIPAHPELLAKSISILNQKSHLFDTTVFNNIRMGRPDASEGEILAVAEQAQLTDLLAALPLGIRTPMEEMGHRFSGGERQRIAFARVLLQETPIVVFDEPTIGLDPKTEGALLKTMFRAAKDKTIIWVTHHLAGIEQMDEIIFLEDGGIAMQGSHEWLLENSSKYRTLYEMDRGI